MPPNQILCAIGTLVVCGAIAVARQLLLRRLQDKPPSGFLLASLIRQASNLAVLLGLWLLGRYTGLAQLPLLAAGALGLTVPTIVMAVAQKKRSAGP